MNFEAPFPPSNAYTIRQDILSKLSIQLSRLAAMQRILRSIAKYALARLSLSILTLFAALVVAHAAELTNQFVQTNLAYGATIQIPRAWKVARGNEMRAIETTVGAALDLSGMAREAEGTESLLFAKLDDPRLYASVGVTVVAIKNSTPRSLSNLTAMDIKAGESSVRQGIESMLARLGSTVSAWTPLEKVRLGDTSAPALIQCLDERWTLLL